MTTGRRASPSDLTDAPWERLEPLIPQPSPCKVAGRVSRDARSCMPSCLCSAADAPGVCCPPRPPHGKPSLPCSVDGNGKESGIAFCTLCVCGCAPGQGEILSRVRPSSTVSPSQRARDVGQRRATTREKHLGPHTARAGEDARQPVGGNSDGGGNVRSPGRPCPAQATQSTAAPCEAHPG